MSAATKQLGDGRPYHLYEIYTPYSKEGGQHHLAAFSVKVRVGGRVGGKGGEGGGGRVICMGCIGCRNSIDRHAVRIALLCAGRPGLPVCHLCQRQAVGGLRGEAAQHARGVSGLSDACPRTEF